MRNQGLPPSTRDYGKGKLIVLKYETHNVCHDATYSLCIEDMRMIARLS